MILSDSPSTSSGIPKESSRPGWLAIVSLALVVLQFPIAIFAPYFAWLFIWGDGVMPPGGWVFYLAVVLEPAWVAMGLGLAAYIRRRNQADRLLGAIGFLAALVEVVWGAFMIRPM
jgi:hypothetical protein